MLSTTANKVAYLCDNYKGLGIAKELKKQILDTIEENEEQLREMYSNRIRKAQQQ